MSDEPAAVPLFDLPDTPRVHRPGRVELALQRALKAGANDGTIRDVDEALGEGALVLARSMDVASRLLERGSPAGGYLAAQTGPPLQKALHALRLPAELTAVPPAEVPTGSGQELPDWVSALGDALGPS